MVRMNKNLSLKDRNTYVFDNFRGVDFSTSPYYVAKNRASYAENLLYENGTLRKRKGFKSLCKITNSDGKALRINGLFNFKINNEEIILCYAGTYFYILKWNNNLEKYDAEEIECFSNNLIDDKINLYVNNNKAFIVGCGDYLMLEKINGNYVINKVFNNAYIPTTTINIDNDLVIDSKRSSFEKVNLLSSWRKNTFVGATLPEDKECLSWITDTKNIKNNTIINVIIDTIVNEELKQIILFNNESDYINLYDTEGNKKGIVDFKSGKISLNFDTTPPIENSSNITIQFCYESEESSFIKNAKLSVLFGGSGDANRLFLSDGTNKHIWSEMNDFSYFPDTNYDILGSESSNIVGYVKGSDGLLLAFKEKNGNDSTIYYITGTDTQKEDSEGNKIFDTIFTKKAGNSNDTIINKNASVNLNGDNLILTQNGIKGVVLQENITTNEYIIQNRSKNIDSRLLQHNLKNAIGFVFKNKYYLAIDNVVYVCDSKFKFQSQDDINNSFNYEWWYLTNIDAQVFCEINNELFFGTSDGNICKFQKEDFEDKKIIEDNVSINFSDNKIIFPSDLKQLITENNTISFYNDVYALHLDSTKFEKIEDGKIYVCDYDFILKIFDGLKCYISNTNENDLSGLDSTKEYEIRDIDLVNKTFSLYLDNTMQKPNNANFSLYKKIDKKELYISLDDCDSGEFKVKEYLDGEPLILSQDIGVSTDLKICIYENKNVVSKWFTSINDFGTNMYSKTLLKLTISTEPMNSGKIQVGYKTKNLEKYVNHKDFSGFSFDNLNFNNFSFEGSFTSSNTFRIKERNFNFMVLRFISDTNSECAVNGITLLYKINNTNKGVR